MTDLERIICLVLFVLVHMVIKISQFFKVILQLSMMLCLLLVVSLLSLFTKHHNTNKNKDDSEVNKADNYIKYDNSCDKCNFKTTNKIHLKLLEKYCHKKIEMINDNVTKKRKSTDGSDDILSIS